MDRARLNIEELRGRLQRVGYRFEYPDRVFRPPTTESRLQLDQQESEIGPLPLSLRAFYEVVGTVDFTQSWSQLVQHHRSERRNASELVYVGEFDPLVVGPLLEDDEEEQEAGRYFFACDEFHKANYSGGENYHVALPEPRADFPIMGMYGIDEFFIQYLRATFAGGGFRGRVRQVGGRCVKDPPNLALTARLAEGLLAI